MQVAGSASREHKNDSHNTESLNNNCRGCCVWRLGLILGGALLDKFLNVGTKPTVA